jgi:hypothetical protein
MSINIYSSSQFLGMDSAYWGLGFTEKQIFIGLCTHDPDKSATLFSFNREKKQIKKLFSLSETVPVTNESLPQGKIHTPLFQDLDGNIYFGTHFAYPFGKPQPIQFEGGHLISFNPKTMNVNDLGIPINTEGILTLTLDKENMILYGLSAPSFIFFSYNIMTKKYTVFSQITNKGSICRSLVVDNDGNVYGSFENNHIFKYNKNTSSIEYLKAKLPGSKNLIKEWDSEYRGGVNYIGRKIWRSAFWHEETKKIYGIQSEESKLFSFDPKNDEVKTLVSLVDESFTNSLDKIYPTLSLSNYKNKLYYTSVNGFFDYSRSENIIGYPSLISYDIRKNKRFNHGVIINGKRKVFGVAGSTMTNDGNLYLLGAVEVLLDEEYNKFNAIDGKGFNIGLIEIDTNQLKYE